MTQQNAVRYADSVFRVIVSSALLCQRKKSFGEFDCAGIFIFYAISYSQEAKGRTNSVLRQSMLLFPDFPNYMYTYVLKDEKILISQIVHGKCGQLYEVTIDCGFVLSCEMSDSTYKIIKL